MAIVTYKEIKKIIRFESYRHIAEEYEKLIDESVNNRWASISAKYEGSELDPVDECSDDLEMLRYFEYRMKLMIICCLCEMWEQDLYNFLKKECNMSLKDNNYCIVKNEFNKYFSNLNIDDYEKINEMRNVVNAIKHGEGPSFNDLVAKMGDSILADSNAGIIDKNGKEIIFKQRKFDGNVLTSRVLEVSGKITEYYIEIKRFWSDTYNELDKKTEKQDI